MIREFALAGLSLVLLACQSADAQSTGSSESPAKFTYVQASGDIPPILLEKSTGCSWVFVPDWNLEVAVGDTVDFDAQRNFARGFDAYALVAVDMGDALDCKEKFGIGAEHGPVPVEQQK